MNDPEFVPTAMLAVIGALMIILALSLWSPAASVYAVLGL